MNQVLSSFLTLALITVLGGCASTNRYREQVAPIDVPARYEHDELASDVTSQSLEVPVTYPARDITTDPWWRGFGDDRLDRMVARALEANSNLAATGFALRQARLEARLATNDLLPQPSASISGSASRQIDTHDSIEHNYSSSNALSWEVDLWGRLRAQRELKQWEAEASAEDLQNTALALVGEVCQNYWNLAYLNQSIATGKQNLAELSQILELVRLQYQVGDVARLELREAEQNLDSERASQSTLLQQRAEVRNAITVLLGGKPWPQADEPQDMEAARKLTVSEGLPAQLLGRRPDLRASELRLRKALANIKATSLSYYPALSLTGEASGNSSSLGDALQTPLAAFGANLSLPFLNISQMKFNTEIAGTAYLKSSSEFRNTLYRALQDTSNAISAREHYITQIETRSRSLEAAREISGSYEVRYRSGASALRIWLDARKTLRSTELALAQTRRDQLNNDVTLALALGGSGVSEMTQSR